MKFFLYLFIISVIGLNAVTIPDTYQRSCYDNSDEINCPRQNDRFYSQDGNYISSIEDFVDNGDGTISDKVTDLMWTKEVNENKLSLEEAKIKVKTIKIGGYNDWRVPTIKELYSLMDFRGYTGFSRNRSMNNVPSNAIPFINTDYFDFRYGLSGERYIDAQWLSSTEYVSTTMDGMQTLFGVNFADGRIKGYGYKKRGSMFDRKKFYVRYVRGTKKYGVNDFVDNHDGTITDKETNLMWMKVDSKNAMTWQDALDYSESLEYAGYTDWRLPNAKELQYIVDYTKSPDTTDSPAIDLKFDLTAIVNEKGEKDWGYYWTSTTHNDGPNIGEHAVYISFGRALGKMHGRVMDVHGAGAQRSDPKVGDVTFHGPQGDVLRSKNYVLCVRGGLIIDIKNSKEESHSKYPYSLNIINRQKSISNEKLKIGRFVQRLDKDGDGRVSRSEFDGPPMAFDHHDSNHDGYLSEDEAPRPDNNHRPFPFR